MAEGNDVRTTADSVSSGGVNPDPVVGLLAAEWAAIAEVGAGLTEAQWDTSTDLPGWTAKDCLSHMSGTELALLGEPAPQVSVDHLDHVTSGFSAALEVWVEARRGVPATDVLTEFTDATRRRLEVLSGLSDDEWNRLGWSPVGEAPYRTFMHVRVFDCWMHEQDIRRAVGVPGGLDTDAAALSLDRMLATLGFVIGKRAGAPEGSTVTVTVTGPHPRTVSLNVTGGRAQVTDNVPVAPTVTITTDIETFCALGGGRWQGSDCVASGQVTLTGDTDLGRRIVESLATTP